MVSLEVVAILLSGIGISASLVYYANVLANANKTQQLQLETRQAQLFIQMRARAGEPGSENWNDIFLVGGILESIGVMVKEGLVDASCLNGPGLGIVPPNA